MNGVDFVLDRQAHDSRDVQVRAQRLPRLADGVRLVRLEPVQGETVFVRVESNQCTRPVSWAERKTRMAISLRLATRSLRIGFSFAACMLLAPPSLRSNDVILGRSARVPVKPWYPRKSGQTGPLIE